MREALRQTLSLYQPGDLDDADLIPAAVLFLIYERRGEPHLVFQRRTDKVDAHKGEVSLPGGAHDPGDTSLEFTALRESHEEIGVPPHEVDILGRLDDLRTITNFRVRPYVGWYTAGEPTFVFHEEEVAYLMEVPVAHLRNPANFREDRRTFGDREVILPSYVHGDDAIWGATGRMVQVFLDVLDTAGA